MVLHADGEALHAYWDGLLVNRKMSCQVRAHRRQRLRPGCGPYSVARYCRERTPRRTGVVPLPSRQRKGGVAGPQTCGRRSAADTVVHEQSRSSGCRDPAQLRQRPCGPGTLLAPWRVRAAVRPASNGRNDRFCSAADATSTVAIRGAAKPPHQRRSVQGLQDPSVSPLAEGESPLLVAYLLNKSAASWRPALESCLGACPQ